MCHFIERRPATSRAGSIRQLAIGLRSLRRPISMVATQPIARSTPSGQPDWMDFVLSDRFSGFFKTPICGRSSDRLVESFHFRPITVALGHQAKPLAFADGCVPN